MVIRPALFTTGRFGWVLFWVAGVAGLLAPGAGAAAAEATQPATAPVSPALAEFAKGTWLYSFYGGYDRDFSSDPKLGYGAIGVGYFIFDGFSISGEARLYGVSQEGPDAVLGEIDFAIRHHLWFYDRWSIFLDASFGVSEASERVPMGGTNFNFIEEAGVGATYRLQDHWYLIGGIRYFHLSNARLHGADENPSLNGIGGYLGVMVTF